jgi:hypothetical protein
MEADFWPKKQVFSVQNTHQAGAGGFRLPVPREVVDSIREAVVLDDDQFNDTHVQNAGQHSALTFMPSMDPASSGGGRAGDRARPGGHGGWSEVESTENCQNS